MFSNYKNIFKDRNYLKWIPCLVFCMPFESFNSILICMKCMSTKKRRQEVERGRERKYWFALFSVVEFSLHELMRLKWHGHAWRWDCFVEKKYQTGAANVGVKVMINDTDAHHHTQRNLWWLCTRNTFTTVLRKGQTKETCVQ